MSKYETLAVVAKIPTVRKDESVFVRVQRNQGTGKIEVDFRVNFASGADTGWTRKGFSVNPEDLASIIEVLSRINIAKEQSK